MSNFDPATIGTYVVSAIGVASVVSAVLPAVGPPWWMAARAIIDILAANVGNAKNAKNAPHSK